MEPPSNINPGVQKPTKQPWLLVGIFFFILIAILFLYVYSFKQKVSKKETVSTDFYTVDPQTGGIVKTEERPADRVITDLDFKQPEVISAGRILKGFFHEYKPQDDTFKLKNQFIQSKTLQLLEVNTTQLKTFACWPEMYPSKTSQKLMKDLEFYVEPDGRDILIPSGEKVVPIDQLETFLKPDNYVILQLTDGFNIEKTNFVQKLIVLGC